MEGHSPVNPGGGEPSRARGSAAVHPAEKVVPAERKTLLSSGKLSVKAMPKGEYHALYQDYVCGSLLYAANAVLGMVPIEELTANAVAPILDTATGHIRETMIVSVFIPRATMGRLNLERIDASDAMDNFVHNIRFLKTKGFQPVEEVAIE